MIWLVTPVEKVMRVSSPVPPSAMVAPEIMSLPVLPPNQVVLSVAWYEPVISSLSLPALRS